MYGGFLYIGFGYNGLTDEHFNDFYRYDPGMLFKLNEIVCILTILLKSNLLPNVICRKW